MARAGPGQTSGAADRCLWPGRMISSRGSDLAFYWWQVLGSNQRRLSRRFYRPASFVAVRATNLDVHESCTFVARRRSVQVPRLDLQHARQIRDVNEHALDAT